MEFDRLDDGIVVTVLKCTPSLRHHLDQQTRTKNAAGTQGKTFIAHIKNLATNSFDLKILAAQGSPGKATINLL